MLEVSVELPCGGWLVSVDSEDLGLLALRGFLGEVRSPCRFLPDRLLRLPRGTAMAAAAAASTRSLSVSTVLSIGDDGSVVGEAAFVELRFVGVLVLIGVPGVFGAVLSSWTNLSHDHGTTL